MLTIDSSHVMFCAVPGVKFYLDDSLLFDFTVWKVLQNNVSSPSYWSLNLLSSSKQSSSKLLEELSKSIISVLDFCGTLLHTDCNCDDINTFTITSFFFKEFLLGTRFGATRILNQSEVYDFFEILLSFISH